MPAITLNFDSSEFSAWSAQMIQRHPQVCVRALNRSAGSVKTIMGSSVAKDMGLKVGRVKEAIAIEEATATRLAARIEARGSRIPLIDFGANGPEPSRGRGRGVTARILGGRGRYPNAFIATMRSGHRGVFQRKGPPRLPIYELFGPSIVHVFRKYQDIGLARGEEQLVKNLISEMRFALSKE